ncbi:hypothetical protein IQ268_19690 [Oculatella sp. LEGE 06141]|uniref:hypothetical protein n=1 Tax=Oculatella sp. LEGE 06141 TaxID=1828648 RepID=UPI00187E88A9|nr:hypothetical protein [Oculatella sp. LEGE 06141]MBE9180787.1 hypothetical protein [Oculatella sp. LEGE 06141]
MNPLLNIQPAQIICLEHETACLYAEVIQVVTARQQCWVRPLFLKIASLPEQLNDANPASAPDLILYDLRQGADLICPLSLFRMALDTEVIPLLTILDDAKYCSPAGDTESNIDDYRTTAIDNPGIAHQQLRELVRNVWQAHPEAF